MSGEWLAQLPDDLKTNEALTGHATLGEFAKAHLDAQGKLKESEGKIKAHEGKIGDLEKRLGDSIPKLTDKATDADRVAYRKALGVPDNPDDYVFPAGADGKVDQDMSKWARGVFHEVGLSKSQAEKVGQHWNGFVQGIEKVQADEEAKELAEIEKTVKAEWADKFEENKNIAKGFFTKLSRLADADLVKEGEYFQENYGNDLRAIRFVFNVAKLMGEGTSPPSSQGGQPAVGGQFVYPDMKK